jgi:hypothetical protein
LNFEFLSLNPGSQISGSHKRKEARTTTTRRQEEEESQPTTDPQKVK